MAYARFPFAAFITVFVALPLLCWSPAEASPLLLMPTIQDTSGGGGVETAPEPDEEPVEEAVETRSLEPSDTAAAAAADAEAEADVEVTPAEDPCSLPKEPGWGRAFDRRFFYNAARNRCEEFVFGGMWGNANNFENRRDCERRCLH